MTMPHAELMTSGKKGDGMLRLIGAFKLAKSVLLIVAAIATLRLMSGDFDETVLEWAHRFHVAPGNQMVQRLLEVQPAQLGLVAAVLSMYSVMYLIEGLGLILLKHWAEWMTIVTTSGLVPVEIFELVRKPSRTKVAALIVNLAIIAYLIFMLRRQSRRTKHAAGADTPTPS
jgi:uncharacterized membrane protein (DUF2068 family)